MMREKLYNTIQAAITEALANTHTLLVAKIVRVNETTVDCKPVVNRVIDGESVELSVFPEVPPIFLQGGGSYTAHPVAVDDYCILAISERCFDSWYSGTDFVAPLDARMFDYSDAFALVGINPLATAITIPKVITHIGDSHSEGDQTIIGDINHTGDMIIDGNLTVTGDVIVNGKIEADGEITAMASGTSVSLSTHLHTGNLGAPTSAPTPGT